MPGAATTCMASTQAYGEDLRPVGDAAKGFSLSLVRPVLGPNSGRARHAARGPSRVLRLIFRSPGSQWNRASRLSSKSSYFLRSSSSSLSDLTWRRGCAVACAVPSLICRADDDALLESESESSHSQRSCRTMCVSDLMPPRRSARPRSPGRGLWSCVRSSFGTRGGLSRPRSDEMDQSFES